LKPRKRSSVIFSGDGSEHHRRIAGRFLYFSDEKLGKRARKVGFPDQVLTMLTTVTEDD